MGARYAQDAWDSTVLGVYSISSSPSFLLRVVTVCARESAFAALQNRACAHTKTMNGVILSKSDVHLKLYACVDDQLDWGGE